MPLRIESRETLIHSELERFLSDLFARCTCDTQPAFMTFTAIHPEGDRPTPSRHVPLGNRAYQQRAVAQLLAANQLGWGAYLGVALRQRDFGRWSRGGKNDLACLPALFVDIDQPDEALPRLSGFDLPASCILSSGRGYHAYWFLDTPTTDFALADQTLRGLAQHLHGDAALTVAQSMRLPGTLNTKPGRDAARCAFSSYHPERLYQLNNFLPFLPKPEPQEARPHTERLPNAHTHKLTPAERDALTTAVLQQLDGRWRASGFIAARCPYPHEHDQIGMHFSYNARTGWGHCFGKHGRIPPDDLARTLQQSRSEGPLIP